MKKVFLSSILAVAFMLVGINSIYASWLEKVAPKQLSSIIGESLTVLEIESVNEWTGKMTPDKLIIAVGETGKVLAEQTGEFRVKTLPTYTSSDPSVATVDSNGNVYGKKAGLAVITGMFDKYKAGTTVVTVTGSHSNWSGLMTPPTLSLEVGETGKVTAEQTGEFRVKTLPTYTSSDPSVATVDNDGNVKALKAGTTTITGKYDNYVAGTTKVTVLYSSEWTGKMTPTNLPLIVGETGKVEAKQTGTLLVGFPPSYTSSDPSVATVDSNGNVKALKAGTTVITGKFGKYIAGTTTVTVSYAMWTGEMIPQKLMLTVGETGKVEAKQTGSIVASTMPTYTSSDPSVATVDSNGNVKAIKKGKTTITGKFGNYVAGTTVVTVTSSSNWSGTMTPSALSLAIGETGQVKAEQFGEMIKTLPTYTSSDPSVATVDSNGNVTALKSGTTIITGKYDSNVAGTTLVTVYDDWSGEMAPTNLSLIVGDKGRVYAKQTGTILIKTLPTYTSSDPSVATVDSDGNVKALKAGITVITGKYGDNVAGTTEVTVLELETINNWTGDTQVEKGSNKISVGETTTVSVRQTGDIIIDSDIVYSSSNPLVATVDENGVVKGLKPGTAVITAKVGNSLNASNVTITVSGENTTSSKKTNIIFYVIIAIFVVACISVVLVKFRTNKYE